MIKDEKPISIVRRLCECGYEAYITGGAARDLFLDRTPDDIDIVTNASPEDIALVFKDGHTVNTVGASFQVTLVDNIDVATYRTDACISPLATEHETKIAETIQEDLSRRDLTINAFAICPHTGEIIDPYNGIQDLKNGIIKFVGDPNKRILEDPDRIIRALRFFTMIKGASFDNNTFSAIIKHRDLIGKYVAPERRRLELLKVMKYKNPSTFFKLLCEFNIIQYFFPSLEKSVNFDGGPWHNETVFEHAMIVGDSLSNDNPLLRLAGYLHDIAKPFCAEVINGGLTFKKHEVVGEEMLHKELRQLKFSKVESNYISSLSRFHMRSIDEEITPKAIRRLLRVLSERNITVQDWLNLKIADNIGNLARENYTEQQIQTMRDKITSATLNSSVALSVNNLAIDGRQIIDILDITPGPVIGEIKNFLLEKVLDDPELNNFEDLRVLAIEHMVVNF